MFKRMTCYWQWLGKLQELHFDAYVRQRTEASDRLLLRCGVARQSRLAVQSIAVVKVVLVAVWLIACIALTVLIANVLVHYLRSQAPAPLVPSG